MPERVIVRLPNWLGDTVMALPCLHAVRMARPDARILAAGPWVSILAGQGLADVLVTYPRAWSGRLRVADTVRAFGGETAILLPSSVEAALSARYWGARRRIGFAAGPRFGLLTDRVALPLRRRHQIDEYLMLAERFGVEPAGREPRLEPPAAEDASRHQVRALLREAGATAPRARLVGIHLGAEYGPAKVWGVERTRELCRRAHRGGATVVLLGAPGDAGRAAEVMAKAPAASLVGKDHPGLLPAVLTEIGVLVSGDTGVAHLAAALGTRVVTLFGPTDPDLTAPRGAAHVLRNPVPCAPCFYRTCPIDHPCLEGIEAATVAKVALTGATGR
jgi:heptosyltransferase-2